MQNVQVKMHHFLNRFSTVLFDRIVSMHIPPEAEFRLWGKMLTQQTINRIRIAGHKKDCN